MSVGDPRRDRGTSAPVLDVGVSDAGRTASKVQFTRSPVPGCWSTTGVAQPAMATATAATISTRRTVMYSTAAMAPRRRVCAWLASRLVWGLIVAVPGCAGSQEWIYEKPRVTPAQLDHDKTACRKIAPSRSPFRIFEDEKVERETFNRCMQNRGYTIKVAPLP